MRHPDSLPARDERTARDERSVTVRLASLTSLTEQAMALPQRPRRANRGGYTEGDFIVLSEVKRSARPRSMRGRGRFLSSTDNQ